jgi:hypothetical protein
MNIELISLIIEILILLGIGSLFIFQQYLNSYSKEKGKNLATKEDISDITKQVEAIKSANASDIERIKVDLLLISSKNYILLNEKIRVFKKLQKRLVDFKKYCEAALGTYSQRGDFHPNLNSLPENIDKAILQHTTVLHEIQQEDFIFLSEGSQRILSELHKRCCLMCSMEKAIFGEDINSEIVKSSIPAYKSIIVDIDKCLQSLYEELNFPTI